MTTEGTESAKPVEQRVDRKLEFIYLYIWREKDAAFFSVRMLHQRLCMFFERRRLRRIQLLTRRIWLQWWQQLPWFHLFPPHQLTLLLLFWLRRPLVAESYTLPPFFVPEWSRCSRRRDNREFQVKHFPLPLNLLQNPCYLVSHWNDHITNECLSCFIFCSLQ